MHPITFFKMHPMSTNGIKSLFPEIGRKLHLLQEEESIFLYCAKLKHITTLRNWYFESPNRFVLIYEPVVLTWSMVITFWDWNLSFSFAFSFAWEECDNLRMSQAFWGSPYQYPWHSSSQRRFRDTGFSVSENIILREYYPTTPTISAAINDKDSLQFMPRPFP